MHDFWWFNQIRASEHTRATQLEQGRDSCSFEETHLDLWASGEHTTYWWDLGEARLVTSKPHVPLLTLMIPQG